MTEQIYINGVLMDSYADKPMQLVFQSPYFTDIKNVVSNRTNTVTFPRTATNMRVVGFSGVGTETDLFAYRRHTAVYKRDGVQVFKGYATLLSVTPTELQMSFVWGNVGVFQRLLDTWLRDLQGSAVTETIGGDTIRNCVYWGNGRSQRSGITDVWSRDFTFGVAGYKHPMLPMRMIARAMEAESGVSGIVSSGLFDEFCVPLIYREGQDETHAMEKVTMNTYSPSANAYWRHGSRYVQMLNCASRNDVFGYMINGFEMDVSEADTLHVRIPRGFSWQMTKQGSDPIVQGEFGIWTQNEDGDAYLIYSLQQYISTTTSGGVVTATVWQDIDVTVTGLPEADAMKAAIGLCSYGTNQTTPRVSFPTPYRAVTLQPDDKFRWYATFRNLPDWTCAELLKQLMQMKGVFAYCKNDTELVFTTIEQLMASRAESKDWTDKVMTLRPTEAKFAYGDYARVNVFDYAQDDTVTGNYKGELYLDNEMLESRKDIFTSKFAATDGTEIRLYTMNGSEVEFNSSAQPRILRSSTTTAQDAEFPTAYSWRRLIADNYGAMSEVLEHPVVIKADFALSTPDIVGIDMTKPIYLRQTGHHYAILTLTTTGAKTATAELIQL